MGALPLVWDLRWAGQGDDPYIFALCFLGAKLGAKSRPLQTVQNQQAPDSLGCSDAWSGVDVQ